MHSRRPLPALALVMPHPQLPTRASFSHLGGTISPHTPRACTPSTPVLFPTQLIASPRTSSDSWGSSNSNGSEEVHWEWKPEQMSLLIRTLDALPGHLYTPFNGPVPPSNLLDKIARSVSQAQGPLEWPHSIRATRAKLIEIARARDKDRNKENMTIDEQDEDQVVEVPGRQTGKRPLYRQSSMDFLPSRDKGSGSLSRLSSRLQRTDRIISAYHPYARPASRSPSPPILTPRSEVGEVGFFSFPVAPVFAPSIPQRNLRPRTSSNSLGSRPPRALRRSASTISTHSNPTPSSTLMTPTNSGVLASIKATPATRSGLIRRSDSFSYAAPMLPTLKRAPSFGASSIASGISAPKQITVEKQAQEPESDDEEKVRQKKAKRPRTRSTQLSALVRTEKKREKKPQVQNDKTASSIKPASKMKPQSRTRSGSMFGAELPQPQPNSVLPSASSMPLSTSPSRGISASPPPVSGSPIKTLRRVKTTTFNLGPCPTARRISFGSLAVPPEEQSKSASGPEVTTALGSAFQMS